MLCACSGYDHLRSRYARLRSQGLLTLDEIASCLHVSAATVKIWARLRHQSARGPDLRAEEVGRHEDRPVCLHERSPRHRALTAWWNALGAQDARDCGTTDVVVQVLQRTLNTRAAPRRILSRHPGDRRPEPKPPEAVPAFVRRSCRRMRSRRSVPFRWRASIQGLGSWARG